MATSTAPPTASPPPPKPSKSHPVSTAAAQFHRFRLTEFNRSESVPPTTSSSGHCSRFRVSDFVPSPWGTTDTPAHTPTTPVAMSPVTVNTTGSPRGAFGVMHMDVDGAGPQQTSSSVAAAAGSGRGVLQKIAVSPIQTVTIPKPGTNPRPLAPSPMSAISATTPKPFDPSTVPQEAVWELSRVLTIFRQLPPEAIVKSITDALMHWPTLTPGSLLRRIGEIFPSPPAPPPADPPRKKRGRPPGKKAKLNDGTSAPVPIAAASMPPPPIPSASFPPLAPQQQRGAGGKAPDKLVTCTRCLKEFNPTWRATPASDPSSEATCAVKHAFKTFETGLEAVTLPRRKNNYKTTWKWKCCGREVQSTSEQILMWPRKEDDRTGGWCFVGKHTTEPGVREKLGLKPGKGKKIVEEMGRRRKEEVVAEEAAVEEKRKRGRPKGSKTRSKVMAVEKEDVAPQPSQPSAPDPEQQLMSEAQQQLHAPIGVESSFWTQYTEAGMEMEDADSEDEGEDPAISTADLSLLASATAAMAAAQVEEPEKRKRGRPKGSRNGKMVVEVPQKALRMKPEKVKVVQQQQQDQVVTGTDEGAPFVGMAGMGGMDYGGLGTGDGGGWFG